MASEPRIEIDLRARERRLYDRIRARISRAEPGARPGILDLILLLPDLAVLLARLVRDPRVPKLAKAIAVGGLAYVVSPIELLPELIFGPLGLIDDVLVAVAAVSRILNHVHPDLVESHWPGRGALLAVLKRASRQAESLVGHVVARVLGFRAGV